MLTKKQIGRGIDWLMEHGCPGVRYRTARELLGWEGPRLEQLRAQLLRSPAAEMIRARQKPDGSWFCGGPWHTPPTYEPKDGYSAFTPKYVTTVWILGVLGNMGLDCREDWIRHGCEYAMGYQMPSGTFGRFRVAQMTQKRVGDDASVANMPCGISPYLIPFGKLGMADDPRLAKSYGLLLRWQREDGGWVHDGCVAKHGWTRSCPAVTGPAAMALYHSGDPSHRKALCRAMAFMVWHLGTKRPEQTCQFFYHGHDMVRELRVLTELKMGLETEAVKTILAWLASMYVPGEGIFRYQGKPLSKYNDRADGVSPMVLRYHTHQLIEDDWLTFHALSIAGNLQR